MKRSQELRRTTSETDIFVKIDLDGGGKSNISTGVPFFDHMLTLFSAHGLFDLTVEAKGDIEVDSHHTVEDVGLVLGDLVSRALGDRAGINRYGHAVVPMDETLTDVTVDLSNRPFLVFNVPSHMQKGGAFGWDVAKEFFRAFSNKGGMNLHVNVRYGENDHHIIESIFKALGRAMDTAVAKDPRITEIRSTKGVL